MKVVDLLENDLDRLKEVLLLMKHGRLPRDVAESLATSLKEYTFIVGSKKVPANLRWVEDRLTGTLKMVSADMPGSWRSGPAAVSRGFLKGELRSWGFHVAGFQSAAARRDEALGNAPHIFFWGPGTPPQDESKLRFIHGTPENLEHIKKHVSKS